MNSRASRVAGTALTAVAASLLLSTCGTSSSDVTSFAPTGIAVKRYLGLGPTSGALDTNFGGTGAVFTKIDPAEFEYALAVALQTDGKILAAGHSILGNQGVIAVVRYNTDGTLDTAGAGFGINGVARTAIGSVDAAGTAIVVQPDGKILVAASTFDASTMTTGVAVVRYLASGSLDTTGFGTGGIASASIGPGTSVDVVSLVLQGTKIVVAGATTDGKFVLKRYDSAGALDATFGDVGTTPGTATTSVGASAQTPAIALQPTGGGIVVAGGALPAGSPTMNAVLVRYSADGALDTAFGGAAGGIVLTDIGSSENFSNAIAVQPADDKIVVAGHANVDFNASTSDIALVRYNADGTLDTSFGSAGNGTVVTDLGAFDNAFSLALQSSDSKIVVSGNASVGGIPRVAIVRYNADGSPDGGFNASAPGGIVTTVATGPSIAASGNAVAVQSDGRIVVAGYD